MKISLPIVVSLLLLSFSAVVWDGSAPAQSVDVDTQDPAAPLPENVPGPWPRESLNENALRGARSYDEAPEAKEKHQELQEQLLLQQQEAFLIEQRQALLRMQQEMQASLERQQKQALKRFQEQAETRQREAAERRQQHEQLKAEIANLLEQYSSAPDDATRAQLSHELQNRLAQQFDLKQASRLQELVDVEQRVAKLRQFLDARAQARDTIVNNRLQQLLGEGDMLGWGSDLP